MTMGNSEAFFLASDELREHSARMANMRRRAGRLRTAVLRLQQADKPENYSFYNSLLTRTEKLERYFAQMYNVLEKIAEDGDALHASAYDRMSQADWEMLHAQDRISEIIHVFMR